MNQIKDQITFRVFNHFSFMKRKKKHEIIIPPFPCVSSSAPINHMILCENERFLRKNLELSSKMCFRPIRDILFDWIAFPLKMEFFIHNPFRKCVWRLRTSESQKEKNVWNRLNVRSVQSYFVFLFLFSFCIGKAVWC